jgi:protein-S-isoprenylcysteine O-methyltransferase Ste14
MHVSKAPRPKLLKARQFHSRLFAVVAIALFCCVAPELPQVSLTRIMMLWVGYALVIIGAFGRVYSSTFIGGRKNKSVIRSGPFSVVRNPLYVFSFLATLGIGLQSGMWTVAIILALSYALYYPFVVKKEEDFLKHKFDESYDVYLKEVPRWFPNFALWKEPEETECKPKFIRRTMADAAVFFIPFPAFTIIALLQANDILPVWLTLP